MAGLAGWLAGGRSVAGLAGTGTGGGTGGGLVVLVWWSAGGRLAASGRAVRIGWLVGWLAGSAAVSGG